MSLLNKAKQVRASARRAFTRAIKQFGVQVEECVSAECLQEDLREITLAFDELVIKHEAVLSILGEEQEDGETEEDYLEPIEKEYMMTKAKARKHIAHIAESESASRRNSPSVMSDHEHDKRNDHPNSAKLERLKLPCFDGDVRMYVSWRKLFKQMIDGENPDVALLRLKNVLVKKASGCLDGFSTYDSAWDQLDARYGNVDIIAKSLLDDIRSLKPVKQSDTRRFEELSNKVREFLQKMDEIEMGKDADNVYVLGELYAKLESEDIYLFKRMCTTTSVRVFSKWLDREVVIRKSSSRAAQSSSSAPVSHKTLVIQNESSATVQTKTCWLCQGSHRIWECPTFKGSSLDERLKYIQEAKACYNCLGKGHLRQNCFRKKTCGKNGCQLKHHHLVHRDDPKKSSVTPGVPQNNNFNVDNTEVILPVVKVLVYNDHGDAYEATALLDTGSQQSLISKRLTRKLNLKGKSRVAEFSLAGGGIRSEKSRVVDVTISNRNADDVTFHVPCFELQTLCSNVKPYNKLRLQQYAHLHDIGEVHTDGGDVDILLGVDIPQVHVDLEVRSGETGPVAKRTPLGWIIIGDPLKVKSSFSVNHVQLANVDEIPNFAEYFDGENMGVSPQECASCSNRRQDDVEFIQIMEESCKIVDGRYQVRLPWKRDPTELKDNYDIALKRLVDTERRLRKNAKMQSSYQEQIENLVRDGYAREVSKEELANEKKPSWYLPHHVVVKEEKTSTPFRLVFDSAASYEGMSLNDMLHKGPNYTNNLFNILCRFRENEVAAAGDIKKMFYQISLHPDDQRYHRFLWRACDPNRSPTVYQMTRVVFGDKPSPDISGYVMKRVAKEIDTQMPNVAEVLDVGRYVDDIVESGDSETLVKTVIGGIDDALERAGFEIKRWHSNSRIIDLEPGETYCVLGHEWNKEKDEIRLRSHFEEVKSLRTKREIFSAVAKFWDPVGLLVPVSIKAKIMLQGIWRRGLAWDEEVEENTWVEVINELKRAASIWHNRCLKPVDFVGNPEIHGFGDASEDAYGACVFLRWETKDGAVMCTLVVAKARVTPLKAQTIPRYELMACVLLTRLMKSVQEALRFTVSRIILWSDSTTSIAWIRSQSRDYKPFVQTRVGEIQRAFDPSVWRYVPSKLNPADQLSKGISPNQLLQWRSGPAFLHDTEENWPLQPPVQLPDDGFERKRINHVTVVKIETNVFDLQRFSSWTRLRNAMAWVLRFIGNTRTGRDGSLKGPLKPIELKNSETFHYRVAQESINWEGEKFKQLIPVLDEDKIYRAEGRLDKANLPYEQRHPIILSKENRLAYLIALEFHQKLGHPGHKRLSAELRRQYWIVGDVRLCKRITKDCVTCKKLRAKAREQLMSELPGFRVEAHVPAFYHTSVDYFGPLKVVYSRNSTTDAFGCVFTCLVSRAIHIELVMDATTDSFLCALRRFAAVRGHCGLIVSDNGTNFVGAQKFIKDIIDGWNMKEIQEFCVGKKAEFEWRFVTPGASHHNGAVERMIRSVRNAIMGTCGYSKFREEAWRTYLAEVGNLVNSRPLYPSSSSISDKPPITPNDLLIGHNNVEVPQVRMSKETNPKDRFNKVQRLINEFWSSWMKYFVPSLTVRPKWWKDHENAAVNDVVLIIDPKAPRGKWKLAQVVEVFPSQDGRVRSVRLKSWDPKWGKFTFCVRPISKTCLLVSATELVDSQS